MLIVTGINQEIKEDEIILGTALAPCSDHKKNRYMSMKAFSNKAYHAKVEIIF